MGGKCSTHVIDEESVQNDGRKMWRKETTSDTWAWVGGWCWHLF